MRPASRTRRSRKRIRAGALIAPSSTIQRSSPLLVTAEIRPSLARLWLTRTTGVRPRGRIAAAAHVVRAQAGLVTPEDHAAFCLGPRRDRRVLPPQPAPHRGRVLLVGPPQRLLGGEAPARQVVAHGAHRQPHPAALPDQLPHRRPAPERKRQAQLVRRVPADQLAAPPPPAAASSSRPCPGLAARAACSPAPPRPRSAKRWQMSNTPVRAQPDLRRDRRDRSGRAGAARSPAAVAPLAPPPAACACPHASCRPTWADPTCPQDRPGRINRTFWAATAVLRRPRHRWPKAANPFSRDRTKKQTLIRTGASAGFDRHANGVRTTAGSLIRRCARNLRTDTPSSGADVAWTQVRHSSC